MNAYSHVVPCFSVYPYVADKNIKDNVDRTFQRFIYALKDCKEFTLKGEPVDPFKLLATKRSHECAELTLDAVLVPVPRSTVTPAIVDGPGWPGQHLARALTIYGSAKGKEVRIALRRRTAVSKASAAKSRSGRPTVQQHIDSLVADVRVLRGARHVILVDDVLTQGTQMMGAARVLQMAGFTGTISGFAAGHTEHQLRRRSWRSFVSWDGASDYPDRLSEQPLLLGDLFNDPPSHRDS